MTQKRRGKRRPRSKDRPGPAGFLIIDKPAGMTSHDVVDAVRRILGIRRVGHLGTLDPQAVGVLPLAIRSATKLVPFFEASRKAYIGRVRLGVSTDTLDAEGVEVARFEGELPDEARVKDALERFRGDIEQVPPMYSAVKKDGVPLHKLAREGREVERPPKKVTIHALELVRFEPPEAEISVQCSAGTYVRTLAADLGETLGCGAHLASLQRLSSGPFHIADAVTLETLETAVEEGRLEDLLIPPQEALDYPGEELSEVAAERVMSGGEISPGTPRPAKPGTRYSALGPDGQLIAILEARPDRRLWPLRVLPTE